MIRDRPAVTVVSPHFDDVPLSLGQSLRDGLLARCDVTVPVVFGRTNWTRWIHPTPGRATAVGAWRRLEEAVAARRFGYRRVVAGWSEAVLRWDDLDTSRLLDVDADLGAEPLVDEVRSWLAHLRAPRTGAAPSLVLVPAGLGGHVDHRIVALAAAQLDGPGVPVGFYEDRPYVAHLDLAAIERQLAALGGPLEAVDVSGPISASTQRSVRRCYPSQMDDFFVRSMERDLRRGARERVWFSAGTPPEWVAAHVWGGPDPDPPPGTRPPG